MKTAFYYRSKSGLQGLDLCDRTQFDGFVAINGPNGSYLLAGRFVALPFCAIMPGFWWRNDAERMLRDVAISQGGCLYDSNGTFQLTLPADGRALDGLKLAELAEEAARPGVRGEELWEQHAFRRAELWREGLAGPVGDRIEPLPYSPGHTLGPWEIRDVQPEEAAPDARRYCTLTYGDDGERYQCRVPADWSGPSAWIHRQLLAAESSAAAGQLFGNPE